MHDFFRKSFTLVVASTCKHLPGTGHEAYRRQGYFLTKWASHLGMHEPMAQPPVEKERVSYAHNKARPITLTSYI